MFFHSGGQGVISAVIRFLFCLRLVPDHFRLSFACRDRMIWRASPAYLAIMAFDEWPL